MLNRKQIDAKTIEFQDFASSSCPPVIGQALELPLNAFGSSVARYEVSEVFPPCNGMITARAVRVA